MKAYQQKPIPLIFRNQSKKYQVNPQALQFFNSLQGKVAVISVAGIYRTGKSFLLNKIILNAKQGFAVGPTTNAKTKGIWVWGKPLISHNQNDQIINVVVMDSEGLGSTEEDINHDLKLFSVTLLMSSAFLYNTVGSIDQNAIDSLGLVLRLCEHLKGESFNDFPDFYWILRDFSLALVDKDGKSLTTKQYLQNCLSPQPGDSQIRNMIRTSIRQSFNNRQCITFVRPLTDQNSLQKLDKMQLDQLRPEFVQQVIDFRKMIFQSLKTKTIKGKEVKGGMLSDLISLYVGEINGDKIPVIETGWKYVCLKQCENALQDAQKKLLQKITSLQQKLPQTKNQFLALKQQVEQQLLKQFLQRTKNNDQRQQSLQQLKHMIAKQFKRLQQDMIAKNTQQTKNFIKKEFQSVQKRFKAGEFGSMAELSKEFEVFYEYFRKKCPYKDNFQVGLEYLMKKFADCSLVVFKSMKTKKETQIASLKEEIQRLSNSLIVKEEKFKSQKQKLNDQYAISQSTLINLQNQNKQSAITIAEYQTLIQSLKNSVQQLKSSKQSEHDMQKITLKKKLLLLQDELRQTTASKGLEISNLRNSLALKENEIRHLNEEKNIFADKLNENLKLVARLKDEKSTSVYEITAELEELRTEKEIQARDYEQRLRVKQQQISKLQNCLQSRVNQLQSLKSQGLYSSQQTLDQFNQQKQQLKTKYEHQLSSLKQSTKTLQQQYKLSSSKLQQDLQQKQMDLKMTKMEMQKERAILEQKIQFLKREVEQKDQKIARLQKENKCYVDMFEEKDNEITLLGNELDSLKLTRDNDQDQFQTRLTAFNQQIKQKQKQIMIHQKNAQQLQAKLRAVQLTNQSLAQKHQKLINQTNQLTKTHKLKTQQLQQQIQLQKQHYDREILVLNQENTKNLQQQKRNIELSIIQLKNYYEMEKERLEKRILEERKKFQYSEEEIVQEIEDKMKKQQRQHSEEMALLKNEIESLQDQLSKLTNQYEIKLSSTQEQSQNQQKLLISRLEILQKKYNDSIDEFNTLETQTNQDRITFIKKIEMLNFEITKKDKQLMQAVAKKENVDSMLAKKQAQIDSIKKIMNDEIESSLKKVQETNTKYQKLNEEYLQFKIDSQKELALCRQRNQFLTSKLSEINKEKEFGSSKNLQNIDKQKITEMKELIEKHKQQSIAWETKIQTMKKEHSQAQANFRKQLSTLDKELQHQKQRLNLEKTKNSDLEQKITAKNELFKKELDELKLKYQTERTEHYKLIDQLKQKNNNLQDQRNSISWKLQKQVALLNDKIQYAERQKEQAKKQLQQSERRLIVLTSQLKHKAEKSSQDQQSSKKSSMDRRISQQLQTMKVSMKFKTDEQQEEIKKLKDELKTFKDRNLQLQDKLSKYEKTKNIEKLLLQEKQTLKREKQQLQASYKAQKTRQIQQWRRKLNQYQKTNKQLMNQNNLYIFQLEKNESKFVMEKNSYLEKITALQDQIEWLRNSQELQRNSSKSRLETGKRHSELTNLSRYSSSGFK